jgi:PhnB protein
MSEAVLTEQLDQAIAAMLRTPDAPLAAFDDRITELLGVAAALRDLPRAAFKASLRNELERATSMASVSEEKETANEDDEAPQTKVSPVRRPFRTVTPYLTVADVHEEIDFITKVFGAEGRIYGLGSAGGFHSEYRIGDSMLMIGGGGKGAKWQGTPAPASLHLYVENVDDVYQRAVSAGATMLMAPTDQDYGERGAAIQDVGGNHWYIATSTGPTYIPEGVPDLMPFFNPRGAPKMIEFMKNAFGAEEIAVYQSPDGVVHHARMAIGNSIVEMGEAHGEWQPRPMTFMLYVNDVDVWYARAMTAEGVVSVSKPGDQAYGDRVGAIKDPFDNIWYIGTRIEKEKSDTKE